jgi:ribosomal protein S18 acetylase RimI-like enzyme
MHQAGSALISPSRIRVVRHHAGARRLRWHPWALRQLQTLLQEHSFWAQGRSRKQLLRMLRGSQAVVTAWQGARLVGFGRASSDGVFRAVLWDVVVAKEHQGQGVGRQLLEQLLGAPTLQGVERVYLMTTQSAGFYEQLGFHTHHGQQLMLLMSNEAALQQP